MRIILVCVVLVGCQGAESDVRCEPGKDGCACFLDGVPNTQTCAVAAGFCCADPSWPNDGRCSCHNAHCERSASGRCDCAPEAFFVDLTPGTVVQSCAKPPNGACCLELGVCTCDTDCSGEHVPSCDLHQAARGCEVGDANNAVEVASCSGGAPD